MREQNGRTIFVDELGAILRQISFGLINTSTFSTKCNQGAKLKVKRSKIEARQKNMP